MRRTTLTGALTGALIVMALVLTACGGHKDEGASPSPTISLPASAMSSTAPGASPAASGDAGVVGGDPSTWSPVLIRKQTTSVKLVTGQAAIFPAFDYGKNPRFVAVSSNPQVVAVLEARKDTLVGIRAIGPGTAIVKVYKGTEAGGQGKYLRKVKVTVTK